MRSAVSAAVARAADRLAAAGVASPRTDARLLAAHVVGLEPGRLPLAGPMTEAQERRYEELVARRAARVPLQYLTGTAAFGRLELAVGPGVFVPRPETELLAEWAGSVLPAAPGAVVVDLCSGAGALALAIAHARRPGPAGGAIRDFVHRPAARHAHKLPDQLVGPAVYAVERSPAALVWLRRNAADRAAAGDPPVEVVAGDAGDPAVLAALDGTVDLVVCNPPYVPDTVAVPPEVADHEPAEAVFAGADGLAAMAALIARAAALLRPGGWFGIEHDETHAEAVPALLRAGGRFTDVADHRDLAGRPRFATARRRGWQTGVS